MIRAILVSPMVRLREWLVCGLPTERVVKALLMMKTVEVVMLKETAQCVARGWLFRFFSCT
jgi:hypothetical protein